MNKPNPSSLARYLLVGIALFGLFSSIQAQELQKQRIVTNSTVYSILKAGDTTFLGGSFTEGGYYSQYLGLVTPDETRPVPDFPMTNGTIQTAISDGNGGWYVGGSFSQVDGQSFRNLVHILSDFTLDDNFRPEPNSTVNTLLKVNNLLYVGGSFTQIGSEGIPYVACLDLNQNGIAVSTWRPNPNSTVSALALNGQNSVFIGGSFTSIAGKNQRYFADIGLVEDSLLQSISTDSRVNSIQTSGNDVYLGGSFTNAGHSAQYGAITLPSSDYPDDDFPLFNSTIETIISDGNGGWFVGGGFSQVNGQSVGRLAHILPDYSVDPGWQVSPNSTVYRLYLDGSYLYVGGSFTQVNGSPQPYAVKIDLDNGNNITSWNPQLNSTVYAILQVGGVVYLGGSFTTVGGQNQRYFATVDALTGAYIQSVSANSTVYDLVTNATTGLVYMGGAFTETGYYQPYVASMTTSSVVPSLGFPAINSTIETIIPDGSGGWFIGGGFSQVGGLNIGRLAHILANGTVDGNFNPSPNSTVHALELSGNILYVGGSFTQIGGQTINRIAAVDATTGALIPAWATNPANVNSTVYAIEADGNNLYVGGSFTSAAGQPRNYLAMFNATTGALETFNPGPNSTVYAFVIDGNNLYVAGSFSQITGANRGYVAAIDKTAATLVSGFNANCNSTVYSLEIAGNNLNLGGSFTSVGGQPRNYIAEVNKTTGVATLFNIAANSTVYYYKNGIVAGVFTTLGGQTRRYIGQITAGAVTSWNPSMNSTVNTVGVNGTDLLLGGSFTYTGYKTRNYMAAFSSVDNQISDAWTATANSTVFDLSPSDSDFMYVAGSFTQLGNSGRNYVGEVNMTGAGTVTGWNPNVNTTVYQAYPLGDSVFLAGNFTTVSGQNRRYAAKLTNTNHQTSSLTTWNPQLNSSTNTVWAGGGKAVMGGSFTFFKHENRNYLLAFNNSTKLVHTWNPNANSTVEQIFIENDKLYVAGSFSQIQGSPRPGLVRYTLAPNAANTFETGWNTRLPSTTIYSFAILDSAVYAVGSFTGVVNSGIERKYAAAFSKVNGALTSWDPRLNSTANVIATDGSKLLLGGSFTWFWHESRNYLMAIDEVAGRILPFNPNVNSTVYALNKKGSTLMLGGSFTNVRSTTRNYLAAFNLSTDQLLPWNPNMNNAVYTIAERNGSYFVGGQFTQAKGQPRNYAAAFTLATDVPQNWDPNLNATVNSIVTKGDSVFVAGTFTQAKGQFRNRLAAFDNGDANLLAFNPDINSTVNTLAVNAFRLYVGGSFTSVGGQTQRYGVAFDKNTLAVQNWNPETNSTIEVMTARDSLVFLGGSFTNLSGTTSNRLAIVGAGQGLLRQSFDVSSTVYALSDQGDYLWVGGGFTTAQENNRARYLARYLIDAVQTTDIEQVQADALGIKVYPNPATGSLFIDAEPMATGRYTLLTLAGQTVMTGDYAGQTRMTLDQVPAGLYVLRLEQDGKAAAVKVAVK